MTTANNAQHNQVTTKTGEAQKLEAILRQHAEQQYAEELAE
jgi:hypothetical protein